MALSVIERNKSGPPLSELITLLLAGFLGCIRVFVNNVEKRLVVKPPIEVADELVC